MLPNKPHAIFRLLPLLLILLTPFTLSANDTNDTQHTATETVQEQTTMVTDHLYRDENGGIHKRIPGVGAMLGSMLDRLTHLSSGSEGQFKEIYANIPLLLPDLYKVFVTL